MSGHTAGPWKTNTSMHPDDQVFDADGVMVADCKWTNHVHMIREANARLIAAAPELLEACRDATCLRGLVERVEWMKRHADDLRADYNEGSILETEMKINAIIGRIDAAIAKAEGK